MSRVLLQDGRKPLQPGAPLPAPFLRGGWNRKNGCCASNLFERFVLHLTLHISWVAIDAAERRRSCVAEYVARKHAVGARVPLLSAASAESRVMRVVWTLNGN